MALDRLLDLLAHRFLCFSCIFICFSCSYVRQTKLARSLVNFWVHNNIVSDFILVVLLNLCDFWNITDSQVSAATSIRYGRIYIMLILKEILC